MKIGDRLQSFRHDRATIMTLLVSVVLTTLVGGGVFSAQTPSHIARVELSMVQPSDSKLVMEMPLDGKAASLMDVMSGVDLEAFEVTSKSMARFVGQRVTAQGFIEQPLAAQGSSADRHEFKVVPIPSSPNSWLISMRTTNPEIAEQAAISSIENLRGQVTAEMEARYRTYVTNQINKLDRLIYRTDATLDFQLAMQSERLREQRLIDEQKLASINEIRNVIKAPGPGATLDEKVGFAVKEMVLSMEQAKAEIAAERRHTAKPSGVLRVEMILTKLREVRTAFEAKLAAPAPLPARQLLTVSQQPFGWLQRNNFDLLLVICVVGGLVLGYAISFTRLALNR